jgi:hypothetical protein
MAEVIVKSATALLLSAMVKVRVAPPRSSVPPVICAPSGLLSLLSVKTVLPSVSSPPVPMLMFPWLVAV